MAHQQGTRVASGVAAVVLPVVVLALAVALGVGLWSRGDLNSLICDGDCGPSTVIPPAGLATGEMPGSFAVAPVPAGDIDPAKVEAAVDGLLGADVLGPRVGFAAASPVDGTKVASSGARAYAPASTTKVLTGFATLSTIDPETRFATRVVASGDRLVLVGGGDPYLAVKRAKGDDPVVRADLTTLARRTAVTLKKAGTLSVSLGFDASLFSGPDASPAWEPTYVTENIVTPVSALWADQGVTDGLRSPDPAASAARTFARLLDRQGISVKGDPSSTTAPQRTTTVATVQSATVAQIVETLVRVSDNQAAEVMLRHVALAADEPATFDGGTDAVRAALAVADVDTEGLVLNDGSGLSRDNRVSPRTMVETLRAAASSARASSLLADLPVSGFTGTLVGRFARLTSALGTVRAKTGTLTGIHSLAGYAVDADGRPVLFAVMADRTDEAQPFAAQAALDKVASAIARCRCGV